MLREKVRPERRRDKERQGDRQNETDRQGDRQNDPEKEREGDRQNHTVRVWGGSLQKETQGDRLNQRESDGGSWSWRDRHETELQTTQLSPSEHSAVSLRPLSCLPPPSREGEGDDEKELQKTRLNRYVEAYTSSRKPKASTRKRGRGRPETASRTTTLNK